MPKDKLPLLLRRVDKLLLLLKLADKLLLPLKHVDRLLLLLKHADRLLLCKLRDRLRVSGLVLWFLKLPAKVELWSCLENLEQPL